MSDDQNTADAEVRQDATKPTGTGRRWMRMLGRTVLLIVVPTIVFVAASYWYATTGRYVSTENAYVKSNIVAISPNIDGRVIEVLVSENQRVKKGDLLFRIDPEPYWIRERAALARRDMVRTEIMALRAEFRQSQAEIAEASKKVTFFKTEAKRQRALGSKGITTQARIDEAEFNLASAEERINMLRQKVRKDLAKLGGDPERAPEQHPMFLAAEADLHEVQLQLDYTKIVAPMDGIVSRLRLEPGEWVEADTPTFGLIGTEDLWIEANLKETQLTHVREGQTVEISIDAYPGAIWNASVASISPATGAEFAVLPPQNASGNWVKVVQRLPVRLQVEQTPDHPPLRAGMTASITIDTEVERALMTTVAAAIASFRGEAASQ